MASVAERVYKITTDGSQALRELNKLNKSASNIDKRMGGFASSMKKAFTGLAAGVGVAVITRQFTQVSEAMDKTTKDAQRLGIAANDLTAFGYAAELSGSNMQQLSTGLGQLSRGMSDLATGTSSDATKALERLGVSVKDATGSLRGSDEVFADIADQFQKLPDGAQKTATAMQLFGRSGKDLIPMLNQGSEGLDKFREEADKLGITFDNASGKMAEQFNDNLYKMGQVTAGAKTQLAEGLLPALINISDEFLEGAGAGEAFQAVGQKIGKSFLIAKNVFDVLGLAISNTYELFKGFGRGLGAAFAAIISGDFSKVGEAFSDEFSASFDRILVNAEDIQTELIDIFELIDTEAGEISERTKRKFEDVTKDGVTIPVSLELPDKEAEEFAKKLSNVLDAADGNRAAMRQYNEQMKILRQALKEGAISSQEFRLAYDSLTESFLGGDKAASDAKDSLEGIDGLLEEIANNTDRWAGDASSALVDMAVTGKSSFKDLASSVLENLAKMATQMLIMKPLFDSFSGYLGVSTPQAKGGVYSGGVLQPFAMGGVISMPTRLNTALIGEAGPEAIMPLRRGADGKLGVAGGNTTVNVINNTGAQASVSERQNTDGSREIDILIENKVEQTLASGRLDTVMSSSYGLRRRGF